MALDNCWLDKARACDASCVAWVTNTKTPCTLINSIKHLPVIADGMEQVRLHLVDSLRGKPLK